MSISAVIFPTGEYTLRRTAQGTRTNGHYESGAASTLTIVAGVQPVEGELLKDLPEGMRADETRVVFTTTELRALTDTEEPDHIEIDGALWRVEKAQRYRILANRTRAWVQRIGPIPP